MHGPRPSLRKAKKAHARRTARRKAHRAGNGAADDEVQVSRLGNPLVNEVVIPLGQKDFFNATSPADDAANFGQYVVKPELAAVINALFRASTSRRRTGPTSSRRC